MKNYFFLLILICSACVETTIERAENAEQNAAEAAGYRQLNLPLSIDTNLIQKADTVDKLDYKQVRQFGRAFFENELMQTLAYDMNAFCKIDSLKQHGGYSDYVKKLDIGMIRDAQAYKIGHTLFKNGDVMYVWAIRYWSYDACPVFYGTQIVGSYKQQGRFTNVLLGEISSWTDPPVSADVILTTEMNSDGVFLAKSLAVSDDMDAPGEDRSRSEMQYMTHNGLLRVTSFRTDTLSKETIAPVK